jgi:hypothetical protein
MSGMVPAYRYFSIPSTLTGLTLPTLLSGDNGKVLSFSLVNTSGGSVSFIVSNMPGTLTAGTGSGNFYSLSGTSLTVSGTSLATLTQTGASTITITGAASTSIPSNGSVLAQGIYSSQGERVFSVRGTTPNATNLVSTNAADTFTTTTSVNMSGSTILVPTFRNGGEALPVSYTLVTSFVEFKTMFVNAIGTPCIVSRSSGGTLFPTNAFSIQSWASGTTYSTLNDFVTSLSGAVPVYYRNISGVGNVNKNPSGSPTYWATLSGVTTATEWNPGNTYATNECATYNGILYANISGSGPSISSPPIAGSFWAPHVYQEFKTWVPFGLSAMSGIYNTGNASISGTLGYYCNQTPTTMTLTMTNGTGLTVSGLTGFSLSGSQPIIFTGFTTTGSPINQYNSTTLSGTTVSGSIYYILSTTGTGNGSTITLGTSYPGTAITTNLVGGTLSGSAIVYTGTPGLDTNSWNPFDVQNTWINGTNYQSAMMRAQMTSTGTGLIGSVFGLPEYNDSNSNFSGTISEIIAYNVALTNTQRQIIEGYLAWKWGSGTSSLPSSPLHPYRGSKPLP